MLLKTHFLLFSMFKLLKAAVRCFF